jgi:hypothetical protein
MLFADKTPELTRKKFSPLSGDQNTDWLEVLAQQASSCPDAFNARAVTVLLPMLMFAGRTHVAPPSVLFQTPELAAPR